MSCVETCRQEVDEKTDKQACGQTNKHVVIQADTPSTPEGLKLLGTQVAGHQFGEAGRKLGMLDRGDGTVLKAVQNPPRGPREVNFYKDVFAKDCMDLVMLELRHFLPCFYGMEHRDGVDFLVLHNVTSRFSNPNVLDLKMGRVSYDPLATPEKRLHERSKYPPREKLGFQIIGMMTHSPDTGLPKKLATSECRSVTDTTMLTEGLGQFFGLHHGELRKDVVKALLVRLKQLEKWFLNQTQLAFYASSLLIVYDSVWQSSSGQADISQASKHETVLSAEDGKLSNLKDSVWNGADGVQRKRRKLDYSSSAHNQSGRQDSSGLVSEKSKEKSPELKTSERKAKNPEGKTYNDSELDASKFQSDLYDLASGVSDSAASHSDTIDQKEPEPAQDKLPVGGQSVTACPSSVHESTAISAPDTAQTSNFKAPLVEVCMIDFAHVFPGEGRVDENYLFGLQRLIGLLEQLLDV